jgi:uncharacterized membrane protein YjjP (DUF1212 family)
MRDLRVDFIMALGVSLHRYGAAVQRVEGALNTVSRALGVRANVFSLPTSLMASFENETGEHTRMVRVMPGNLNLAHLATADSIADKVIHDKLPLAEALQQLRALESAVSAFPRWLTVLAFATTSAGISVFFHGGALEVFASLLTGALVGILGLFWETGPRLSEVGDALSAFFATLCASLFSLVWPELSVATVVLSALIILLPGLTLTIAMSELASGHLVAGTARSVGAAVVALKLGFGTLLGTRLFGAVFPNAESGTPDHLAPYWTWIVLPLVAASFIVTFRARVKDGGWVTLAGILGFSVSYLGNQWIGAGLGVFVTGLVIGSLSNALARWRHRPALTTLMPGIISSVPGSLGYRAATDLVTGNGGGIDLYPIFVIAVSLVAGLLFGNILVEPRRNL